MYGTMTSRLLRAQGRNYPRLLKQSANGEGPVQVDGLGTFSLITVGSTNYKGVEVTFLPHDGDEVVEGKLRYHLVITPEPGFRWVLDEASMDYGDHDGGRFGARVWEAAQQAVDSLHLRAPTCWSWHMEDAARFELISIGKRRSDARDRIIGTRNRLKVMLVKRGKGIAVDQAAIDEQQAILEGRIAAQNALHADTTDRIASLGSMRDLWRDWTGKQHRDPRDVVTLLLGAMRDPTPAREMLLAERRQAAKATMEGSPT